MRFGACADRSEGSSTYREIEVKEDGECSCSSSWREVHTGITKGSTERSFASFESLEPNFLF